MTSVQIALEFLNLSLQLHELKEIQKLKEELLKDQGARPHVAQKTPDQASSSRPTSLKPIKHNVLHEDHQLAAAERGVVYVIAKDASIRYSNVWVQQGELLCWNRKGEPGFRATSPPFVSMNNALYLGVKVAQRPAVHVRRAKQFLWSLQGPRAANGSWEYTSLAQSASGKVIYCGCSDGAIEVWERDDDGEGNRPRVYRGYLTGHVDRIQSLATGQDGTLVSADKKDRNGVRVWRHCEAVATIYLKQEKVCRLACTLEKKMYRTLRLRVGLDCGLATSSSRCKPGQFLEMAPCIAPRQKKARWDGRHE